MYDFPERSIVVNWQKRRLNPINKHPHPLYKWFLACLEKYAKHQHQEIDCRKLSDVTKVNFVVGRNCEEVIEKGHPHFNFKSH